VNGEAEGLEIELEEYAWSAAIVSENSGVMCYAVLVRV
jgi:hypothetical protein